MSTPTPIKRDKSFVLLSREHHDGLMLVWKIRQGGKFGISNTRITNYTLSVFDQELEAHFIEEEKLLFDKLDSMDEFRKKAEDQHAAIRKKVAALRSSSDPQVSDLMSFAQLLEEHIRFEERLLFPHIEKLLSREELDAIGEQISQDYSDKQCVVWQDEFWLKK